MRPIVYFLIGLSLFIGVFAIIAFSPFGFMDTSADWLAFACLFLSALFSLFALIKGIRLIRKKENSFILSLVSVIGSSVIIVLFINWAYSLLRLLYSFNH